MGGRGNIPDGKSMDLIVMGPVKKWEEMLTR
jgi:hypothetical protein